MTRLPSRRLVAVATISMLAAAAVVVAVAYDPRGIPTEAEDRAAAARMVLTFADLVGFVPEPDDGVDSPSPINECVTNPFLAGGRAAGGPDLVKDNGNVRVSSGVQFAERQTDAQAAFAELETALAGQCVEDALKASLEASVAGLVVGDVTSEQLPVLDVADEMTAYRLIAPLEAEGARVLAYVELVVLRDGRALGAVFIFQAASPFPEGERIRLTNLVAERMSG